MVANSTAGQRETTHQLPVWEYEDPPNFSPYFYFEKWDFNQWRLWFSQTWTLPFYICVVYLLLIFSLQNYMKERKGLTLRGPLILWNLALGVFSMVGLVRMLPEMVHVLVNNGFYRSVCSREGLNAPTAIWGALFVLSKVVELGDTLFLCVKKQPLIFLHWYHHCTALLTAWLIYPFAEPISRVYMLMNYAVHSLMYPYYMAKAMKFRIPRKLSMFITSLQLLQMVVGVGVNIYTLYCMYWLGLPCARESLSIKVIAVLYGSFTFLFADFMKKRYFNDKTKKL